MQLRPIPAADWADWYENELCTTFPDCECKPLADILSLAEAGRYEVLGLYDGPDLLGYAALWSAPDWPGCVLLDYLGVTAARRNGGRFLHYTTPKKPVATGRRGCYNSRNAAAWAAVGFGIE